MFGRSFVQVNLISLHIPAFADEDDSNNQYYILLHDHLEYCEIINSKRPHCNCQNKYSIKLTRAS